MSARYKILETDLVELLKGPWRGIVYEYGGVQFAPDEANQRLVVRFTYKIHSGSVWRKAKFKQYIGDILLEILQQQIQDGTLMVRSTFGEDIGEIRDEDTGEPAVF